MSSVLTGKLRRVLQRRSTTFLSRSASISAIFSIESFDFEACLLSLLGTALIDSSKKRKLGITKS